MGVFDVFNIGKRALNAASAAIEVTSQNVANASTVGYSRRRVLTRSAAPIQRSGQWLGTGVEVNGVRRATDRLLGIRLVAAAGAEAKAVARETVLATAEGYFSEQSSTGLHESLASMYDAFSALTTDPSDLGARREAIAAASALASTTARIATNLTGAMDDVEAAAADHVATINSKLAQVGALNRSIGRSGVALGPGDLLDQRDQLVRELGDLAGATVDFSADGQATVFIGGHAAVSGKEVRTLSTAVDAAGVTQIHISVGAGTMRVTEAVGGELGGSLQARDSMLSWMTELDDFAATLAATWNAQSALGFDANGTPGADMFTYVAGAAAASLSVVDTLSDDPTLLALAGSVTADPGDATNLEAFLELEETLDYAGLTGADALSSLTSLVGSEASSAYGDSEALAHNSPCGNDLNRLSERECVLIKCDLETAELFQMWIRFLTV